MTVTGTIWDEYGNPVLDGTLASFDVTGSAFIESNSVSTSSGLVAATLSGGDFAWSDNVVTLRAGNISASASFPVRGVPVRTAETSLPQSVEAGSLVMLPVAFGDSQGSAADGVSVFRRREQHRTWFPRQQCRSCL